MKRFALIVLVHCMLSSIFASTTTIDYSKLVEGKDYVSNTIIIKLKPGLRQSAGPTNINNEKLKLIFSQLSVTSVKKIFPNHTPPEIKVNRQGQALADLSLIYEIKYSSNISVQKAAKSIINSNLVMYAEPRFIQQLLFTPNDPNATLASQYFLTKIKAYEAWDIEQGDTNIVIGIVDTGTDPNHPDLEPNIKYNYADTLDGIDNDNDGYIDNFIGWDLGQNDSDATVVGNPHGSHVSGCAAAATNNNLGVAAPGFNCKFLPIKISDESGSLSMGYEGITYAADHGCSVINCSWGGNGGGTFGQDIITYATINKGSIVFCGAGNNSNSVLFYPAGYEYAIAVGSTNESDQKSGFSNFGSYIDFCAPGSNIYTAMFDDQYSQQSGTSMASPVAAGACALVRSKFPNYTGIQAAERLRATADNIDNVGGNGAYKEKLGSGRINLFRALTDTTPSIRMENITVTDNNDGAFVSNETLDILGNFTNYLDPTSNVTVTMSILSGGSAVTIVDGTTSVGSLNTMETKNNNSDPFKLSINGNAQQNSPVTLKFLISDGSYSASVYLDLIVNVDYINVDINDIKTTITSKGRLGYNSSGQNEGLGFMYRDSALLYEAGLMVGIRGNISDNVRGASAASTDDDWKSVNVVKRSVPDVYSHFDLYGSFNDNGNTNKMNISVNHRSFAWVAPADRKYIIVEYVIYNNDTVQRDSLYAGIFADWDIGNYAHNKASVDSTRKLGYVYNTDSTNGLFGGIQLLSSGSFNAYSGDNSGSGLGGVNFSNGYDNDDKFTTLYSWRKDAGSGSPEGNDVVQVVSTGPFSLAPTDSVVVAFALLGGDSLADLQASANAADLKYPLIVGINEPSIAEKLNLRLYPNPAKENVTLDFHSADHSPITIVVYDIMGRETLRIVKPFSSKFPLNTATLNPGIYTITIIQDKQIITKKLIIE